ncbi:MAG: hypothetical protein V2B15_13880 [Bacteroidota bacterium]
MSLIRKSMTRPHLISFLLLSVWLCSKGYTQSENEIDWYEEIDLVETELVKRHPDLFFNTDSASFYRAMDRVVDGSKGKSLFEVSVMLQQVVAGLGDAQTLVNYHYLIDNQEILPLECYWFEDGLYIIRAREEYGALLGKRIAGINQYPLAQVVDSLTTLISGHTPSMVKNAIPRMITWTQLLTCFGFSKPGLVTLLLESPDGEKQSFPIVLPSRESNMTPVNRDKLPLAWEEQKEFFRECYMPDEEVSYIQYNKCWSREAEQAYGSGAGALFMPSFREFEKEVMHTIRSKKVKKLVLDMRFNGGGNPLQGTRFIKKLARTNIGDHAAVFLIVGRGTFSSALINAVEFMETFQAVVVGEDSGGKPNHYGEIERFVLPRTNLVISCSTRFFSLVAGDPPAIHPDISAPLSFTDFMNGVDPALEAVLQHQGN